MSRPSKILVTGGAGFIGSHVVDKLVSSGYAVRVIDNLSTGSLANIHHHVQTGRVDFVRGDVREREIVRKCIHDVDVVVCLAAITSVPFSVKYPSLTYATNVTGMLNLLSSCAEENVKKIIFISSCAVYGEPTYLPIDEDHQTNPISPYAASKLAAERHCRMFQEKYGLETVILRLFNVYGPRQGFNDYSGVIAQFVEQVKHRLPLIIFGDGSQTRDFVHVWDVVEAVSRTLKSDNAEGEVFNVAFGKPVSLSELAKTVLELTDTDLDIVYEKPRDGDIMHSSADITKAEKWLDYKPKFPLKDGLRTLLNNAAWKMSDEVFGIVNGDERIKKAQADR